LPEVSGLEFKAQVHKPLRGAERPLGRPRRGEATGRIIPRRTPCPYLIKPSHDSAGVFYLPEISGLEFKAQVLAKALLAVAGHTDKPQRGGAFFTRARLVLERGEAKGRIIPRRTPCPHLIKPSHDSAEGVICR
jgi:hypothetical protein